MGWEVLGRVRSWLWLLAVPATVAGQEATDGTTSRIVERPEWTDATVRRASSRIEIDGRVDEAAWADAESIALPWEIEPRLNVDTELATDCRITFDDRNLYFGCRMSDPDPGSIRAFLVDRDQTDGQDEIGLVIDPFRDSRRAFGFNLNALGVQKDWVYDREQGNDAWNAIWDSRGRLTSNGWEVEAAIPFASLRFPATTDPQDWGFFVWRGRPRSEEVSVRSVPRNPSNQCALCQMAVLRGVEPPEPGLGLEVAPYATVERTDSRPEVTSPSLATGPTNDEYGVDARWSVTSDLTANLTINPDFSQVEADGAQLQSNQQFALFFPERRPFFLEGSEIFETTPFRAVFTRTIADPSVGAKLTGKGGAWAYGVLAARDERTNLLFPGPQSSASTGLESANSAFMARVRRDVGEASTVGGLVTARDGEGGYRNLVAGADARVRIGQASSVTAQVLGSETEYPTEVASAFGQPMGSFGGWAARAHFDYRTRTRWLSSFVSHTDPGLRADGGFVAGADFQQVDARGGFNVWMDDHPLLTRIESVSGGGRFQETDGTLIGQFVFTSFGAHGARQSRLSANPDVFWREYRGQRFRIERLNLSGEVQPTRRIYADFFFQLGRELDFANTRESGLTRLSGSLDLRLGRSIEWDMDYDEKRLTYLGQRVFRESIAQTRVFYHFSSRLFFRAIVQLRDVARDPALYVVEVDPTSRSLDSQLLLSYKVNPQSVVLVGYSDASLGIRENQDPFAALDLTRLSRSFFLKLSYAWRP
ncbi:MAG: DUF5916 domain-containing protein [Gemmatimonadota bacterium]